MINVHLDRYFCDCTLKEISKNGYNFLFNLIFRDRFITVRYNEITEDVNIVDKDLLERLNGHKFIGDLRDLVESYVKFKIKGYLDELGVG